MPYATGHYLLKLYFSVCTVKSEGAVSDSHVDKPESK